MTDKQMPGPLKLLETGTHKIEQQHNNSPNMDKTKSAHSLTHF